MSKIYLHLRNLPYPAGIDLLYYETITTHGKLTGIVLPIPTSQSLEKHRVQYLHINLDNNQIDNLFSINIESISIKSMTKLHDAIGYILLCHMAFCDDTIFTTKCRETFQE